MASGNVIVILSGSGIGVSDKGLHPDLLERLKTVLEIFLEMSKCSGKYGKRGFFLVLSKAEQPEAVLKEMQRWLEQEGIPRRCILVERFSHDLETSAFKAWRYYISRMLTTSSADSEVRIVSQFLDALMFRQMLAVVSNERCQGTIRTCPYANWKTFLAGVRRFVLEMAVMQTSHEWKWKRTHRPL